MVLNIYYVLEKCTTENYIDVNIALYKNVSNKKKLSKRTDEIVYLSSTVYCGRLYNKDAKAKSLKIII